MRTLALALVAVAGCDRVLGLRGAAPADASDAAFFDAPPLLVPPDGSTACKPPPNFSTWTYTLHTVTGGGVFHPTFYAPDRVIFGQTALFDSSLDGPAQFISELGTGLTNAGAAPAGDVFWFENYTLGGGVGVATRTAAGWHATPTLLLTTFGIEVGSVGFYAGEARMVVQGQPTTDQSDHHLYEIASHDGIGWRMVGEVPLPGPGVEDPALSPDGCYVVFVLADPAPRLYVAARGPDGAFMQPSALAIPVSCDGEIGPAVDPTQTRLWFTCQHNTMGSQLYEGRPP